MNARSVAVADGELHVEERGSGSPVLLIQGLGQAAWVWRWVAPRLAEGRRAVAFDHRGTGRSSFPPPGYGIPEMAADAAAVLRALGTGSADVVGLSMGGYVALTLALREPALVRSLALIGTGAGGPDRVPRPTHVRAIFAEAMGMPHEQFGRVTMPYTFASGWVESHPREFEQILAARLERPTSYEALEAHVQACYRFYEEGVEVERITVPALVIHGDQDLIIPVENGRKLAARLPNAEYVELAGRGHNLPLEEPETIVRLVQDFVDRLVP